jgi:hypothetical protein
MSGAILPTRNDAIGTAHHSKEGLGSPSRIRQKNSAKILLTLVALLFVACGGGSDPLPPFWVGNGLAVADLNADGLADIALAKTYIAGPPPHAGSVAIFLQTPNHSFAPQTSYLVGSDPWSLAVGDVNGDQRPDVVVANTQSGTISILIQASGTPGNFLPAQSVTTGGTPYGVAISDIDSDGYADLAVALQNSGGGALVLLQNPAIPLAFLPPISLTNGTGATAVAVGDLNHDGRVDVVVNGDTATLFFQTDSGGSFGPAVALSAGVRPADVVVADLDSDDYNDLLVANAGSAIDGSGATLSVLLQVSDNPGSFSPVRNYPVAGGARHLALGQLMGDAAPDIAVLSLVFSTPLPSTISTLENLGAGSFVIRQTLTGPFLGDFIASGDLNGDGLIDLVVNDGPEVFVQQSASPGIFDPGIKLPGSQ